MGAKANCARNSPVCISGPVAAFAAGGSRADDTEATVSKRLAVYREQTAPVADYYRSHGVLKQVDGMGTVEEVAARIDENLKAGTDA